MRGKASDWGLRPQVGPPVHLSDRAVVATKGGGGHGDVFPPVQGAREAPGREQRRWCSILVLPVLWEVTPLSELLSP